MRTKNMLLGAIAAAAITLVANAANATVLTFSTGDVHSGSYGNSGITPGGFTDTLSFFIPTTGSFSTSVINGDGFLDFTSLSLAGPTPFSVSGVNFGAVSFASLTHGLTSGNYILTISGTSSSVEGSYGGQISWVSAIVPEPATWSMMIVGMGGLGAMLRRNKRTETTLAFA